MAASFHQLPKEHNKNCLKKTSPGLCPWQNWQYPHDSRDCLLKCWPRLQCIHGRESALTKPIALKKWFCWWQQHKCCWFWLWLWSQTPSAHPLPFTRIAGYNAFRVFWLTCRNRRRGEPRCWRFMQKSHPNSAAELAAFWGMVSVY